MKENKSNKSVHEEHKRREVGNFCDLERANEKLKDGDVGKNG